MRDEKLVVILNTWFRINKINKEAWLTKLDGTNYIGIENDTKYGYGSLYKINEIIDKFSYIFETNEAISYLLGNTSEIQLPC